MSDDVQPSGRIDVLAILRRRWLVLVLTPVGTLALALIFLFIVQPLFEAHTTLRFTEEQSPLGGGAAAGLASGGLGGMSGLSLLAGITGQSIPVETEIQMLQSRSLAQSLVDDLGLRMELRTPRRTARTDLFRQVQIGSEALEGDYDLRPRSGGGYDVKAEVVVARNPFRPIFRKQREKQDLGSVDAGGVLPIPGTHIVLASEPAHTGRIRFRILAEADAVDGLSEVLSVDRPERDADLVQVGVRWPDPELAVAIADTLAARFIERKHRLESEDYDRLAAFLGHQLDSLKTDLSASEEDLRAYRESQQIVDPEAQAQAAVDQLAELQGKRDLLSAEHAALTRLLEDVRTSGTGSDSIAALRRLVYFPSLLASQSTAEMLRLLGELENERAALLDHLTPESREVTALSDRVRTIELSLRDVAETYLSGLDKQVASLDDVLSGYRDQLERVPAVELEYARRRRQVELLNQLYVYMQGRQKEVEVTAAGESRGVRIIDRAEIPLEPVRPQPGLTLVLALLVGLVLGAAGAVALEQG